MAVPSFPGEMIRVESGRGFIREELRKDIPGHRAGVCKTMSVSVGFFLGMSSGFTQTGPSGEG